MNINNIVKSLDISGENLNFVNDLSCDARKTIILNMLSSLIIKEDVVGIKELLELDSDLSIFYKLNIANKDYSILTLLMSCKNKDVWDAFLPLMNNEDVKKRMFKKVCAKDEIWVLSWAAERKLINVDLFEILINAIEHDSNRIIDAIMKTNDGKKFVNDKFKKFADYSESDNVNSKERQKIHWLGDNISYYMAEKIKVFLYKYASEEKLKQAIVKTMEVFINDRSFYRGTIGLAELEDKDTIMEFLKNFELLIKKYNLDNADINYKFLSKLGTTIATDKKIIWDKEILTYEFKEIKLKGTSRKTKI